MGIYRQALAVKCMPLILNSTLQVCVNFMNYIKSRPLNSRIFTELCSKELGSKYEHLLHGESQWLSKGNVLKQLLTLKN